MKNVWAYELVRHFLVQKCTAYELVRQYNFNVFLVLGLCLAYFSHNDLTLTFQTADMHKKSFLPKMKNVRNAHGMRAQLQAHFQSVKIL